MSAEPRKRVSQSEIIEELLALLAKTGGEHSTIEISDRNAKSIPQITLALRTDPEHLPTPRDAARETLEIYKMMRAELPLPEAPAEGNGAT